MPSQVSLIAASVESVFHSSRACAMIASRPDSFAEAAMPAGLSRRTRASTSAGRNVSVHSRCFSKLRTHNACALVLSESDADEDGVSAPEQAYKEATSAADKRAGRAFNIMIII